MVDVLVEPEPALVERDVAGVVPVEDVDVVVGQQGADRGPSSVAKCPEMGPTSRTRGWPLTDGLAKCSRVANGVDSTGVTSTAATPPSTATESMPQSGRT